MGASVKEWLSLMFLIKMDNLNKSRPLFEKYFDPVQNLPYYYNRETKESAWVLPDY